jgi:hypothetical protein
MNINLVCQKLLLEGPHWGRGIYASTGHLAASFHCISLDPKRFLCNEKLALSGIMVASAFRPVLADSLVRS